MAHRELRKRVPIDLTITQWKELLRKFPGRPLSQTLLEIHTRGLAALEADAKESV